MVFVRTPEFATAARTLAAEARRRGLVAPGFRCPPRLVGVDRTIRRRGDGGAVVAVRLRDRPVAAVCADMVEGVIVTNRLRPPEADRVRAELWRGLVRVWPALGITEHGAVSAPDAPTAHAPGPVGRVA